MSLDTELESLRVAVDAATGRLDPDALQASEAVLERAAARLRLSADHTVVALGGSTGSGKSSLFNALVGIDLAGVGARRPTTSWTLACSWGPNDPSDLLEWVGIPERHRVTKQSSLDEGFGQDASFDGLVLLDMPDHDSIVDAHHAEVNRVVEYADLFIWVVDPQKYADAAIHERYLRPLSKHFANTVVVMNQVDRLSESDRELALADLRRILDRGAMTKVPLFGISVLEKIGLEELQNEISKRITSKDAAKTRLHAEVRAAAVALAEVGGTEPAPGISAASQDKLVDILVEAAGVPDIAKAVNAATVRRAAMATDWPILGWFSRMRKDPLRELGLGSSRKETVHMPVTASQTVLKSRTESALREMCDGALAGVEVGWRYSTRDAASAGGVVIAQLDAAVNATELPVRRRDWWWPVVGMLQWATFAAVLLGIGWLVVGTLGTFASLNIPDAPNVSGVPLPLLLIGGGIVLGLLTTVIARSAGAASGRKRAVETERALRASIAEVADREVVARIEAEIGAYERFRTHVLMAQGDRS